MELEKSTKEKIKDSTQFKTYLFSPNKICSRKIDFDILCVYNNDECFHKELLRTLKEQNCKFNVRLISFNNKNNYFTSMAKAYNMLMLFVESENVLFAHQDICFDSGVALENLLCEVQLIPRNGIWGIGGVADRSRKMIVAPKGEPQLAVSIDECLFGMKTDLCRKLKFNDEICDNWHMYSAEMCIHNRINGGEVFVVNSNDVRHLSPGIISSAYVKTLYRVINAYKQKGVETIWTTCAKVDLTKPYRIYISIWLAKHELLNKIVRPLKKKVTELKRR